MSYSSIYLYNINMRLQSYSVLTGFNPCLLKVQQRGWVTMHQTLVRKFFFSLFTLTELHKCTKSTAVAPRRRRFHTDI